MNKLVKTAAGYNVVIDSDIVASLRKHGKIWDWTWADAAVPTEGFETLKRARDFMEFRFPSPDMPSPEAFGPHTATFAPYGFAMVYAGIFGVQWDSPGARIEWIHHAPDPQWTVSFGETQFRVNSAADAIACLQHHNAI